MKKIIGISLIVFAVFLFSCNNDKIDVAENNALSEKSAVITLTELKLEALATTSEYEVEFYANAEEFLTRWWKMGKRWEWTNKTHYLTRQCPNVTIIEGENNGYPKTITLDYGDGTVLKNEKVLSGIIVVEISAPRKSANYTRTVTYDNFGIDTVKIAGTSLITINKTNENFRNYKSDLTITLNDETVITRSSVRTWNWIEGMETTEDQTDDVIQIDGVVTASNSAGDIYKKEIVEPLVRSRDCRFIVKGIVEISLNDKLVSTLNYGDGTCDAVATMTTVGSDPVEIDLATFKRKENKNQNGKK